MLDFLGFNVYTIHVVKYKYRLPLRGYIQTQAKYRRLHQNCIQACKLILACTVIPLYTDRNVGSYEN